MNDNNRIGIIIILAAWSVLVGVLCFKNTGQLLVFAPNLMEFLVLFYGIYTIIRQNTWHLKTFSILLPLELVAYLGVTLLFVQSQSFRNYVLDQVSTGSGIVWETVSQFARIAFQTILGLHGLLAIYVLLFMGSQENSISIEAKLVLYFVPVALLLFAVSMLFFVGSPPFVDMIMTFVQTKNDDPSNNDFLILLSSILWYALLAGQVLAASIVLYYMRQLTLASSPAIDTTNNEN